MEDGKREVGELLETYREVKNELLHRTREKASEMGLESSPEVVGNNPEEWAYFLIGTGEK